MASLELRLIIDSAVSPELYKSLAGIGNDPLREERLRQLASTGLIWEHLRVAPTAREAVELGPSVSGLRRPAPRPAEPAVAAVPALAPLDIRAIPVLREVVFERGGRSGDDAAHDPAHHPMLEPVESPMPPAAPPDQAPPTVDQAEGPLTLDAPRHHASDFAEDLAPAVQMSGTRSRLMRMKSRGLFKNE